MFLQESQGSQGSHYSLNFSQHPFISDTQSAIFCDDELDCARLLLHYLDYDPQNRICRNHQDSADASDIRHARVIVASEGDRVALWRYSCGWGVDSREIYVVYRDGKPLGTIETRAKRVHARNLPALRPLQIADCARVDPQWAQRRFLGFDFATCSDSDLSNLFVNEILLEITDAAILLR